MILTSPVGLGFVLGLRRRNLAEGGGGKDPRGRPPLGPTSTAGEPGGGGASISASCRPEYGRGWTGQIFLYIRLSG